MAKVSAFPVDMILKGTRRRIEEPSVQEKERLEKARAYIFNLTDIAWPPIQRTYGVYVIAAKKKGERYSVYEVKGRLMPRDMGDDGVILKALEPEEIAADVAREINENCTLAGDAASFLGVMVSSNPELTAEEYADGMERLVAFQDALCAFAFRAWSEQKDHKEVTGLHRWAGRQRGIKADWLFSTQANEACRACNEMIPVGAAKCPKCLAILDMSKMREFFPLEYAEIMRAQAETVTAPVVPQPGEKPRAKKPKQERAIA